MRDVCVGGQAYPVHPLDTVANLGDTNSSDACVGLVCCSLCVQRSMSSQHFQFQPITFDSENNLDMILGMVRFALPTCTDTLC
jgi:hypothetical protein